MGKKDSKKFWGINGGMLILDTERPRLDELENAVYHVHFHPEIGFYLTKMNDGFTFDYKIYGLETDFIRRVLNYYDSMNSGNLGILLNGLKGTGKTVTSKIIAAKVEQPVIIVDNPYKGLKNFINSIPQDITIFIDEFEKVFKNEHESDMLTIMDGAFTSKYRRLFLLTTNYLRVDENLLERPSRVRYLKKFGDLPASVITEVVDDCLIEKEFRDETIGFISKLRKITIDIVKAVINEVNVQKESPFQFADIFNVEMNDDRYKAYFIDDNNEEIMIFDNETMNFRSIDFNYNHVGETLKIGKVWLGRITDIFASDVLEITNYDAEDEERVMKIRLCRSYATHSSYDSLGSDNRKFANKEFLDKLFPNKENEPKKGSFILSSPFQVYDELQSISKSFDESESSYKAISSSSMGIDGENNSDDCCESDSCGEW